MGEIDPFDEKFSAFVFKIQANMNKAHRDRIAFMRICSGKFTKGEDVFHMQGGKKLKLAQPQQFMAENREIVEEAYAGDIIGVFDPGIFSIGDTLCSPSKKFKFEGIPIFAPEHFARVRPVDTMKRKTHNHRLELLIQSTIRYTPKEISIYSCETPKVLCFLFSVNTETIPMLICYKRLILEQLIIGLENHWGDSLLYIDVHCIYIWDQMQFLHQCKDHDQVCYL